MLEVMLDKLCLNIPSCPNMVDPYYKQPNQIQPVLAQVTQIQQPSNRHIP